MVQIKVTPEMLEEVAKRANDTKYVLESIHKDLYNQIEHLADKWTGVSMQKFYQDFNEAKPKAFTATYAISKVEEDLKQIAEKFRNADASYDGNLVDGKASDDNIEEGATCGPLNSEKKDDKKDESLLDKFKHGVEDVYEEYSKIKDFVDDKVEDVFEKAGLGVPYHFKKGMEDAIGDELLGLADAVIHPIDTFNNTIEALSDPVGTFNALKQTISDSWNNDVVNGDWNSSAAWYGSASAHTILAVGQLFVGTKGVDKIAMLNYGTKLSEVSQAAKQGSEYAASFFKRNHNEFAIAGAGSGRPSIQDFLWRADNGDNNGGNNGGNGGSSAKWQQKELLDELANSGVKYNTDELLAITKTPDGKLVWLEKGNSKAGFEHVLRHADEFATKGIEQSQIPEFLMEALTNGEIVGYQGRGAGRPIYEFSFNGQKQRVAITVGNNGFIVGANPK